MTVHSTKRRILNARTSSWKSSTKRGTRSLMTLRRFTKKSRTLNSSTISPSSDQDYTPSMRWIVLKWLKHSSETLKGSRNISTQWKQRSKKTKRVKLVIHDEYMHAVALNFMFQSGEYKTGVLETPGRPANLDSVENDLLGGLRCETMLRSRLVGRRKTLWCFCHIWSCTWKESKKATTEARTSKNSGARPAHK